MKCHVQFQILQQNTKLCWKFGAHKNSYSITIIFWKYSTWLRKDAISTDIHTRRGPFHDETTKLVIISIFHKL